MSAHTHTYTHTHTHTHTHPHPHTHTHTHGSLTVGQHAPPDGLKLGHWQSGSGWEVPYKYTHNKDHNLVPCMCHKYSNTSISCKSENTKPKMRTEGKRDKLRGQCSACESGWPEPYIYTVYDRIFGDFFAKNTVNTPYIYMALANPTREAYAYIGSW